MRSSIEIVEVGARDGLQNEPELIATADKITLIRKAQAAGARRIEIASFVNPKRVPQMADAEDVVAGYGAPTGITRIGLVLNVKGAQRAIAAGVDELGAVVPATDGFSIRNQGQSADEALAVACEIVALGRAAGRSAQATISVAFGCPFDGEVDPGRVAAIAARLAEAEPREIAIADTIGAGVPPQVKDVMARVRAAVGPSLPIRAHFHNTRNTGLANAWAALEAGAATLDSSLGGLGGCPFAPKATGNIPTEDLVFMLERGGVTTGLDLDALIEAAHWLSGVMGKPLPAMVSRAGRYP